MATTPTVPSPATQALIAAAGQTAADLATADAQVATDQTQITAAQSALAALNAQLGTDQAAAAQAGSADNAAFVAAVQSLAHDFGVGLPVTIPAAPVVP